MRALIALLLLLPAAAFAAGRDFAVAPAPAWVERLQVDTSLTLPKNDVRWGVYSILDDHQVRVASSTTDYFRRVRKIVSTSGVQNASELNFDFDPSYQRLVIHDITRIRDGGATSELHPAGIRVIEKEDDSDSDIYDGMLTAVAFLDDVRAGDVLDYSWSLEGANPLLGGKYADTFDITSPVPARLIRHRLLFPKTRSFRYRTIAAATADAPRVTTRGSETELVWERTNVAPLDVEDEIPDWFDPYDHIQVTEFTSWSEVAQWASALFRMNGASRSAVRELAARIRAGHASRTDQIAAAIRFVQDDIRYLGIEMGRNTHEPHQPAVVLEQRWGDCKDKSFLLAALLGELGLDAHPAMVNTKLRRKLDDQLPSPFLFDHVITQVADARKTYWIDPTLSDQGGTLETIETPNDERALVVRDGTTALTRVAIRQDGSTTIEQTFTTPDWNAPTTLAVRSTYTGGDADALREDLATMSLADFARKRLNRYATDLPHISPAGPPQIADDRVRNIIVVNARYTVHDPWRDGKWSYTARAIADHLRRPETIVRSMPLAFDHPLNLTQKTTFHLPGPVRIETGSGVVEDPAFRFEYDVSRRGNVVTVRHRLRGLRDAIPVADVADHVARINAITDDVGLTIRRESSGAAFLATTGAGQLGLIAVAMLALGAALAAAFIGRPRRD